MTIMTFCATICAAQDYTAPLVVNVSPASITESKTNASSPWTSGSITTSVTGGTPSYSYAWTWQSGGAGITINSPSSSSTTITASGTDTERSGTLLCTVTDQDTTEATDTCIISIVFGTPP